MVSYEPISSFPQAIPVDRIFLQGDWVALNGKEILWLPPNYRAISTAVYKGIVAIGCPSGRVVFLEF
jgi:hypothetical protein